MSHAYTAIPFDDVVSLTVALLELGNLNDAPEITRKRRESENTALLSVKGQCHFVRLLILFLRHLHVSIYTSIYHKTEESCFVERPNLRHY